MSELGGQPRMSTSTDGVAAELEVPPTRREAVDRAREAWIRRLIDLSRRNNLLYYRDLKTGTLDLTGGDPEALKAVLAGDAVTLARLLPGLDAVRTAACAQEIRRRAVENLEERGLETLYLALGMATWAPADEGRPPEAPVLLLPVSVELRGRDGRAIALRRTGEVQVNLVLLHVLEVEHRCVIDAEALFAAPDGEEDDAPVDPQTAFARLTEVTAEIKGFAVKSRIVLGNFSFQKMAMVKDLRERGAQLAAHDLIAALAGDGTARDAVLAGREPLDPRRLDLIPPEHEFLILDADASQQRVVGAAVAGQDGVVHGPPGTGKSQTIANLIATLAAQGRRVLFVAEKRAALEVVLRRLNEVDLGHLALDLHGADVSRRSVMKQLDESLKLVREAAPVDPAATHERFSERRARLNQHVVRLHTPRPPSGLTVYELQGRLLRTPAEARSTTRWRGADLDRIDRPGADAVRDLLVEAQGFGDLFLRTDPSPWTGAELADGLAVQQAMDLATRLARERCPALRDALAAMAAATGLRSPATLEEARALVSLLSGIAEILSDYSSEILGEDLDALARALTPARRGRLAAFVAWCSNPAFRQAARTMRRCRRNGGASAMRRLADATAAAFHRRCWRLLSTMEGQPRPYAELHTVRAHLGALCSDLAMLAGHLQRPDLADRPLEELQRFLDALAADAGTPPRLVRLGELERELAARGVSALITELRTRKPAPATWPVHFESAWLASCLDRARIDDPAIAGFNGRTHEQFVDEFRRLDRQRLRIAAGRVRRAHAERVIAAMNAAPEQAALVKREAAKRTRHLPLRALVAQAPDVVTVVRPCWMASPLSVSQLLPADRRCFDVVLFDEASQVLPEDSVPALLRGTRAVVAGDRQQLPPTTFFAAGDEEEDAEELPGAAEGFESFLDLMTSFLDPWPLEWHYRSRDEALIAFANHHVYGDRLVTFPGPGGPPAVSLVPVAPGKTRDGDEDSPSREVERVVQLAIEHAEQRPDETLGVIALGIRHARRVEAAVDAARIMRPDLDEFFDEKRPERFFVKNLERVQGDERDAIVLTIGAGKDGAGRLDYRQFGPLNQRGSERRLNVAITRARRRMTVVASFTHADMEAGRHERGVELLRLYLGYAASGGVRLGDTGVSSVPLNAFELDVQDALSARGLSLVPQWGASRYRIDLVARHPTEPGRFVLAIECDGASYHSAYTARDRDRLRQQHLEALGWRFHRIWSTDWFLRREEEIARAVAAFDTAVRRDVSKSAPADVPPPRSAADAPGSRSTARGPRPHIPQRERIQDYSPQELVALVRWLQSDGRLRTDDELVREMVEALGFERLGRAIDAEIRRAIAAARAQ